ncbi:MAG: hypothetical protein GY795_08010 [Desulfobacterales bacterium]|nr:hypothetical protein [Desulfobacterales bacterium]
MILLVNSTVSDAAERQSDKAWGFEPQVYGSAPVCALKGRWGKTTAFPSPLQGANRSASATWGSKPQALSLCRSAASEVFAVAAESVEFTNSIMNCRAIICRP